MLITQSGWGISPTDRGRCDALNFRNLSGCEQLVRYLTLIAGNRLDLVMTDAPDIVNVFVGTPLGISDHCFVSCVLQVEESVPEYNVRNSAVTMKGLSEAYKLGPCPLCSQELYMEHNFEVC